MGHSDFLPPVSTRSGLPREPIPPSRLWFAPSGCGAQPWAGTGSWRAPAPYTCGGGSRTSQVTWEPRSLYAALSDPGGPDDARPLQRSVLPST